ncbi:zinc finger protein 182-like [Dendroctonus ponderosae]|uniref:zinc finger protein 182-like n=1 Tax=Dendroctonus ponderosae TaxID=77166 RepID=UPI0020350B6B|nr:zinc finger protein 182-like [Dendroctonus ponderosae]
MQMFGTSNIKTTSGERKENFRIHLKAHTEKEYKYSIDMTPDFCMQVKEEITIDEEDFYGLVKIEDDASGDLSSSETTYEQAVNAAEINQRHFFLIIRTGFLILSGNFFQIYKNIIICKQVAHVATAVGTTESHVDLNSDFYINVKEEITIEEENMCVLVKVEEETISNMSETETVTEHTAKTAQVNQYNCNICATSFVNKSNLKIHLVTHSKDRPFQCDICGLKYKQIRSGNEAYIEVKEEITIDEHNLTEYEQLDLRPDDTSMSLTSLQLNEHLLTHAEERPHACDVCHQRFKEKNSRISRSFK